MSSAQESGAACRVHSLGQIERTARVVSSWLQRTCTASILPQAILLQAEVKRAELEQERDALQQRRQLLATTLQERNRLHDSKQKALEQHDMYVQLQRLEQQIRTLNQVSSGMCFVKVSSIQVWSSYICASSSRKGVQTIVDHRLLTSAEHLSFFRGHQVKGG